MRENDPELHDFLTTRLPYKPYCSDELSAGIKPRKLLQALERRYIQLNPPHLRWFMVFDVDREGAAFAWEEAGLPHPTWIAINGENGHGHLVYTLEDPVLTAEFEGRQAPLRYLASIEEAYRTKLRADDGYSSLITKNPMNLDWYVLRAGNNCLRGESLDYFAEFIELNKLSKARRKVGRTNVHAVGLGRNCTVFNQVSQWSYRNIRDYKSASNFENWHREVLNQCLACNSSFLTPLLLNELRAIAKSIAKWVWYHFNITASDRRFSKLQAHRNAQRKTNNGGRKNKEIRQWTMQDAT